MLALRDVTDGSRNAGTVYGFDTFTITPALTVSYGSRYARYDYLENRNLVSPRVELTVTPAERIAHQRASSRARPRRPAPRNSCRPATPASGCRRSARSRRLSLGVRSGPSTRPILRSKLERDFAGSTVALRAFRQQVDDQLVTLFGADLPAQPNAKLGHYLVGNAGDVAAIGCTRRASHAARQSRPGFRRLLAHERSDDGAADDSAVPRAPRAVRASTVTPSVSTMWRRPSRRMCRKRRPGCWSSTASATASRVRSAAVEAPDRPGLGSRFDVQVRQSLPFLNFTSAKWEMLVGGPQLLQRNRRGSVRLRRTARRPAAQAHRRRRDDALLGSRLSIQSVVDP